MLKKTKEFGQFGNFVEDSGGAIRIPNENFQEENIQDPANDQWIP